MTSTSYYPTDWESFVGQPLVKRQLRAAASSARARAIPMGHVLLAGPTGVGKTSLALLIAQEIGTHIRIQSGPIKQKEVPLLFSDLEDRDILFLDEAHRLGVRGSEWLLEYLQDGVVMGPLGSERVAQVTVILATTELDKLPEPVLGRFELTPILTKYGDSDAQKIATLLAGKILEKEGLPAPSAQTITAIARAASNHPRIIRRLLCAIRDASFADNLSPEHGQYDLTEPLTWCGLTDDGLTVTATEYLLVMMKEWRGTPAGAAAIKERVTVSGATLADAEMILMDRGYLARTGQGRVLTSAGMRRARELDKAS